MAVKSKTEYGAEKADVPENTWGEPRDWHPGDRKIRRFFEDRIRIHSRPKKGPTTWLLEGEIFTQQQIEEMMYKEIISTEKNK